MAIDYAKLVKQTKGQLTEQPAEKKQVAAKPTEQKSAPPQKSGGIFSSLSGMGNKLKKASEYATAYATNGISGLSLKYAAEHPKESLEGAAGFVKNTAKVPIQLTKTGAGEIASISGNEEAEKYFKSPSQVPILGEVKALSAKPGDDKKFGTQTAGETAIQAANMYLEAGAPGAGKVIGKVGEGLKSLAPSMSKTGEVLSNVPARILEKVKAPAVARQITENRVLGISDAPEEVLDLGRTAFNKANSVRQEAMKTYQAARDAIIAENEGQVLQRSREFADGVGEVLKKNKIKVGENGIDVVGSQFEGSPSAPAFFQRAHDIMSRPLVTGVEAVDDLLTRREAISGILKDIPVTDSNTRRVIKDMVTSFDTTLDNVLGEGAKKMRAGYAEAVKPTNAVIEAMTVAKDGKRTFSPDRASSFIKQAMSDTKFDRREMLADLDRVAGTNFEKIVEAVGLDKAISRLDPQTSGRFFDVVKTYVIGKIPLLSASVSPKFWGELALREGLKDSKAITQATKNSNEFLKLFLKNAMTYPLREASSPNPSKNQTQR